MSKKYTWKDIVKVKGEIHAEEFEISGEMDEDYYRIDDFMCSVARKYGVDTDDVETYMMDDIDFDARELPFGAEDCGCYIDGIAEWLIQDFENIKSTYKAVIIKPKRGTLEEWNNKDYIPLKHEIIVVRELDGNEEVLFKLGDGIHMFKDLDYVSMETAFKYGFIYSGTERVYLDCNAK